MQQVQILIAGISASGKSTFGKWLADTKGFIHVDMELPDTEPYSWGRNGLRKEWEAFCKGSDRDSLIREIKGRASSVVLNWGFPPRMLSVVSALKASGVSLWWFNGDRVVARSLFEVRATQRLSASDSQCRRLARRLVGRRAERISELQSEMDLFDSQYEALSKAWAQIEPLFRGHVITTLGPDGSFMENEEIFSRIMGLSEFRAGWPQGIAPLGLPRIRTCPLRHTARHIMNSPRDGSLSKSALRLVPDSATVVGSCTRLWVSMHPPCVPPTVS